MVDPLTQTNHAAVFDRKRIAQNRARAAEHLNNHGFLIDWAADQILDRLSDVKRDFPKVLQIGTRSQNSFSEALQSRAGTNSVFQMDLFPSLLESGQICADEEFLPFANESLDLILNIFGLHSINDLPGALIQMRRALKPDGLFIGAMLGGETLYELRQCLMEAELSLTGGVSPRIAPMADKQDMGALMQRAGFALPVIDSDIITVTYDHIFDLMRDIRLMGEGNAIAARSKTIPARTLFVEAARLYAEKFAEDNGRIKASFEVIFVLGWSPHDSQQKPLKPGSAKNRLADALGHKEHKL